MRELPLLVVVYLCSKRAFYIRFILIENANWPWKRLFYAKVFLFTRLWLDAIVIATDTKAQNHPKIPKWLPWSMLKFSGRRGDCSDRNNYMKPESIVCVLAIWSYERKLLQIRLITQCALSNMILVDKALYPLWLSTTVSLMLHVRGVFLFLLSHACVVYTFSITCLTRSC